MLARQIGISTAAVIGAVVVVVIIAAGAFFLLSGSQGAPVSSTSSSSSSSTSSSSSSQSSSSQTLSSATVDVQSLLVQHLQAIDARQVDAILVDYTANAVVVWQGNTAGLGGTYNGQGNIRLLLASALGTAQTLNLTPSGIAVVRNTGAQVTVNATLALTGNSQFLGPFNATILASTTYANSGGAWKISDENWDFKSLAASVSSGATTFPEWQRVGEPIATRRSADWVHNFAWDFGGPGISIAIWAFVALVAAAVVVKKSGNPKSS